MTSPGRNQVGTAYVVIRGLSKNLKKDILDSCKSAFKDVDKEAKAQGEKSGRKWGVGFKQGVKSASIQRSLSSLWRDIESDASNAGRRAGERYASAYNSAIKRAARQNRPNLDQTNRESEIVGSGNTDANDRQRERREQQRRQRRRTRERAEPLEGGGDGGAGAASAAAAKISKKQKITFDIDIGPMTRKLGVMRALLSGIQALAGLAAAALAALAGSAAIGGLGAVIASLSQMSGLLLALPAAATAAALAIGTIKVGFSGIGDAITSGFSAMDSAADDATSRTQAIESAQSSLTSAIRNRDSAERAVTTAQENRISTQQQYTQAVKDAGRELEDYNLKLKGSRLDEEDATIAVARARERLNNMPSGSSALDWREARNNLEKAKQSLEETRLSNKRLTEDATEARDKGIKGNDGVVSAKKAIKDADQAIVDAQQNLIDSNKAVADAQKNLTKAMTESSGSAKAFEKAMAKLSPSGQEFVRTLIGMRGQMQNFKKSVQENLLKGMGPAVKKFANSFLPVLQPAMQHMATTLNGIGKDVMGSLGSPDSLKLFSFAFSNINKAVEKMRPGFTSIVNTFRNLTTVGSMFLPQFGQAFSTGAGSIEKWSQNFAHVYDVLQKAVLSITQWWQIVKNLGSAVISIFSTAQDSNFIQAIVDGTKQLKEFVQLTSTQNQLAEFFSRGRDAVYAIMPVIQNIILGVMEIGRLLALLGTAISPGAADFFKGLTEGIKNLQPAIEVIGPKMSALFSALGEQGPQLGTTISELVKAFSPYIDLMRILAETLLPAVLVVLEKLAPVISALSPVILVVAAAWKAATVAAAANVAITRVSNGLIGEQRTAALRQAIATKLAAAATKVWTVVQAAFNAVMSANPIAIAIIAIAALVAAIVIAYKKSETFRNVVQKVWGAIKSWISDVWNNTLKPIFTAIVDWIKEFVSNHMETFKKIWSVVLTVIQTYLKVWWGYIKFIFMGIVFVIKNVLVPVITWLWKNVISPVFTAIGKLIGWVWNNIIKPAWEGIKFYIQNILIPIITWLWKNVISPIFNAIGKLISWVWNNIIKPAWAALKLEFQVLGALIAFVWNNVIKPIWSGFASVISWLWNNVLQPAWEGIKVGFQAIGDLISWVWDNIIKPVWDAFGTVIGFIIDNVIQPAFERLKSGIENVKEFFSKMVSTIGTIWDGIKSLAAKPINFIIDTVYNNGIAKVWNSIAGLLGMDDKKLKKIDKLPEGGTQSKANGGVLSFKNAGVLPGYTPGRDVHDFVSPTGGRLRLSGGEAVMRPEFTKAVGGIAGVNSLNAAARRGSLNIKPRGDAGNRKDASIENKNRRGRFDEGGVTDLSQPMPSRMGSEAHWQINTIRAARAIAKKFPQIQTIGGWRPYDAYPFHPQGLAADVMIPNYASPTGRALGDAVNRFALGNARNLGIDYTIWKQYYQPVGGQGNLMEDQGGDTANHFDHVHVNTAPSGYPNGKTGFSARLGGIWSGFMGGIELIKDKIVEKLSKPLRKMADKVPTFGSGAFGQVPKNLAKKAVDDVIKFAEGKADKQDAAGGGSGGKVLGSKGTVPLIQKPDGTWTSPSPAWAHLIQRESGGVADRVQEIQDVNSGGNEASGLFQIAKGTWASNGGLAFAPTAGQATPEQQATIAARIFNQSGGGPWGAGIPGRENEDELRAGLKKYDSGGWLKPGKHKVLNKTGKPEPVLTNRQWNLVKRNVAAVEDEAGKKKKESPGETYNKNRNKRNDSKTDDKTKDNTIPQLKKKPKKESEEKPGLVKPENLYAGGSNFSSWAGNALANYLKPGIDNAITQNPGILGKYNPSKEGRTSLGTHVSNAASAFVTGQLSSALGYFGLDFQPPILDAIGEIQKANESSSAKTPTGDEPKTKEEQEDDKKQREAINDQTDEALNDPDVTKNDPTKKQRQTKTTTTKNGGRTSVSSNVTVIINGNANGDEVARKVSAAQRRTARRYTK